MHAFNQDNFSYFDRQKAGYAFAYVDGTMNADCDKPCLTTKGCILLYFCNTI